MSNPIRVEPTPHFRREFKQLRKRFRSIQNDLKQLTDRLEQGETPGDPLQDMGEAIVFKVRIASSDMQRGKSGGFRVIYYVKTETRVLLISIYAKVDREDLPAGTIHALLRDTEEADDETSEEE